MRKTGRRQRVNRRREKQGDRVACVLYDAYTRIHSSVGVAAAPVFFDFVGLFYHYGHGAALNGMHVHQKVRV